MARLAVIPIRGESSPLGATTTTTSGWACDLPWRLTRWNSLARCRRNLRCIHFSRGAGGGLRRGLPRLIPHPSAVVCCGVAPWPPACSPGRCQLRVPVDLLDVRAADRQACAALGTPCRQYFAAAASRHARAEAVHTCAATNLGLIGTLGHPRILLTRPELKRDYTSRVDKRSNATHPAATMLVEAGFCATRAYVSERTPSDGTWGLTGLRDGPDKDALCCRTCAAPLTPKIRSARMRSVAFHGRLQNGSASPHRRDLTLQGRHQTWRRA
jgi:hypothetical protein